MRLRATKWLLLSLSSLSLVGSFAAPTQAGVIPWVYNAIFGPARNGAYYGGPAYGGGAAYGPACCSTYAVTASYGPSIGCCGSPVMSYGYSGGCGDCGPCNSCSGGFACSSGNCNNGGCNLPAPTNLQPTPAPGYGYPNPAGAPGGYPPGYNPGAPPPGYNPGYPAGAPAGGPMGPMGRGAGPATTYDSGAGATGAPKTFVEPPLNNTGAGGGRTGTEDGFRARPGARGLEEDTGSSFRPVTPATPTPANPTSNSPTTPTPTAEPVIPATPPEEPSDEIRDSNSTPTTPPATPKAAPKKPAANAPAIRDDDSSDTGPVNAESEKVAGRKVERKRIALRPNFGEARLVRRTESPKSPWTPVNTDTKLARK